LDIDERPATRTHAASDPGAHPGHASDVPRAITLFTPRTEGSKFSPPKILPIATA